MNRSQRSWNETLDLIAEAGADSALWADVTDRLMIHTHAVAGAIYVQNRHDRSHGQRATEFQHMCNFEERWIDRYFEHYAQHNPFLNRPEFHVSNRTMTDRDLRGEMSEGEREFQADWREPQRFDHVVAQFLQNRREGSLTLVFWRDREAGHYGRRERAEFGQLARAIDRSVRMGDRLRAASVDLAAAHLALDRLSAAVITLDERGHIRSASPAAEALMAARDGVVSVRGRPEALDPRDRENLRRLVDDILSPERRVAAEQREVPLRRSESALPIMVTAAALQHNLPAFQADPGAAALLLLRIPPLAAPLADRLAARWGLTPAEARLATLLLEPLSLQDAASRLGIGRETARTQLKALFGKTGTQRQTELVVRLLTKVTERNQVTT